MSNRLSRRKEFGAALKGFEIAELTPVMIGGDPLAPENKVYLTRKQHIEFVNYWNAVIYKSQGAAKS